MASKGLFVVVIALCAIMAFQVYRYLKVVGPDEDILRSEMIHYRTLNWVTKLELLTLYHRMEGHARHSLRPEVTQAYADGQNIDQAFRDVVYLVNEAYAMPEERSDEYIRRASDIHDEAMKLLLKRTGSNKHIVPIRAVPLDKDFPGLDLCKRECDLLLNFRYAMDYYFRICDSDWGMFSDGDIFMANLGVKYLSDTVEVFMPSVIRRGETKLIEISASKKYFDNVIDSLQKTGVIPADRRPFYKGVMKLSSDDLSLKPLSNERQVITEHDYTVWRYDIEGKDPGKKKLNCEVGVIVLDFLENPEEFYIPLKLPALEVY